MRGAVLDKGITINGRVSLDDAFDLAAYFTESVIGGPGAFVMAVESYRDFAQAIRLKLVREISGEPLAALRPAPRTRPRTSTRTISAREKQQSRITH